MLKLTFEGQQELLWTISGRSLTFSQCLINNTNCKILDKGQGLFHRSRYICPFVEQAKFLGYTDSLSTLSSLGTLNEEYFRFPQRPGLLDCP